MSRNQVVWVLVAVTGAAAAVGVAGMVFSPGSHAEAVPALPPAVSVNLVTVTGQTVNEWREYSGRLEAVDKVEVRPLVSGAITQVRFASGSLVNKGDVLFVIDPRPYAAEVERATAAQAAAQARAVYTRADLARAEMLVADNAIPRRTYDEKQNAEREAQANLQAASAALQVARLNLEHTRVVAPISGRVSRAEMTAGNVVSAGAATQPLTSIVSISPIYASFDVDEQTFLRYIGTQRNNKVPVFMGLATEDGHPRQGSVDSVDNQLDTGSGTVRVRAIFDNRDGSLMPGLYARLRLSGRAPHRSLLVSDKAVGVDQDKKFVLVVDEHSRAVYREVQLGSYQDGLHVVVAGLREGERIVADGMQRAHPGDLVQPATAAATTVGALK